MESGVVEVLRKLGSPLVPTWLDMSSPPSTWQRLDAGPPMHHESGLLELVVGFTRYSFADYRK